MKKALFLVFLLTSYLCAISQVLSVNDFTAPYYGLKQQGSSTSQKKVPLVVIAWEVPENSDYWSTSRIEQLKQLIFGSTNSVSDWYKESSQNRYITMPYPSANPISGPVTSVHTGAWFGGEGTNNEGFANRHHFSYAEAVKWVVENKGISFFKSLDKNNDNFLSKDECIILIAKKGNNVDGFNRSLNAREIPNHQPLIISGLKFDLVSEVYTANDFSSGTLAVAIEEVLHQSCSLTDQYPDGTNRLDNDPKRPGNLELTDAFRRPVHTDPFHKLKWGWLNPKIYGGGGKEFETFTIKQTSKTGDALIIYNPSVGTKEFFIIENRWKANSYDAYRESEMNEGLAIWHCIQSPELNGNYGRTAILLRRAEPRLSSSGNIQIPFTLFAGNNPSTSYTLSDVSMPQNLKFKMSNSSIVIKNISNAGATMTLDVKLNYCLLSPEDKLTPGQFITSPNGKYKLIYQNDGNLVLYKVAGNVALWGSQTNGQPAGRCEMQPDGNLVIYKPNGQAIWSTGTFGGAYTGSYLRVQDDANVVIYKPDGSPSWSTQTYNEQKMLDQLNANNELQTQPWRKIYSNNRKYFLEFTNNGNLELRVDRDKKLLWQSGSNAPGGKCKMQPDGNFVIYNSSNVAVWSSGTYGPCHPGSRIKLQDDANLVIYRPNNAAAWATVTDGEVSNTAQPATSPCN